VIEATEGWRECKSRQRGKKFLSIIRPTIHSLGITTKVKNGIF
jgi:hypothetical protein